MGVEIEHKYLVKNDLYKGMAYKKSHIIQAYLNRSPDRTVRIRIVDDKGFLTIKGRNKGDWRLEYEYSIPYQDAIEILKLAEPGIIEKTRYFVKFDRHTWEVDEFGGNLKGVVVAEVELPESMKEYPKPEFIGEDITGDPKYYNSNLSDMK